jgi:hypothetical protein
MIHALAFVPTAIFDEYAHLLSNYFKRKNGFTAITLVFTWFLNTYVHGNYASNHGKAFWNVYIQTLNNIPRTSDSLEGFDRFLNAVNDVSNPNIRTLGKEIVKIQQEAELYLLSILYDNEEDVGNKIDFVLPKVLGFEEYYDGTYMEAIALVLKFPIKNSNHLKF